VVRLDHLLRTGDDVLSATPWRPSHYSVPFSCRVDFLVVMNVGQSSASHLSMVNGCTRA
jgi:hypothetical protein